jgi:hypothetical protein
MTTPVDPPASPVQIRGYRAGDLRDLYRICLQTGDSGADATGLFRDPELLGCRRCGPATPTRTSPSASAGRGTRRSHT